MEKLKNTNTTVSVSKIINKLTFRTHRKPVLSDFMDYTKVSFRSILALENNVPCDVYVHLNENKYTKVIKRGDSVDHLRLKKYQTKGVKALFIRRSDRRIFVSYAASLLEEYISDDFIKFRSAQVLINELSQQTLSEIYKDGILDEETISSAQVIVNGYVKMLEYNTMSMAYLLHLVKDRPDYVRHSVSTAIFSILLARSVGDAPHEVIALAGLGGLLHDIGMVRVKGNINELDPNLSMKDRLELEKHPRHGADLLDQAYNCPKGLKQVILEHHELWDGSGYPQCISGEKIFYVARIVAIADYFSSLTKLKYKGVALKPVKILRLMKKKNWFDPYLLDAFADLLKVKI